MKRLIVLGMLACAFNAHAQETFRYRVEREKLMRNERGDLQIDRSGVSYRSDNGKTTIRVPLLDVREADLSDPDTIRIETYDILKRKLTGRRVHTFRLTVEGHDEELARFLAANLKRPVVAALNEPVQGASFEIPAYHRHRFGGCPGRVLIDAAGIRFLSDQAGHSRTWLYRDVETIGSGNQFQFRVTTLAETYTMELKEPLPERAYRLAWSMVYDLPATTGSDAGPASHLQTQ